MQRTERHGMKKTTSPHFVKAKMWGFRRPEIKSDSDYKNVRIF